MNAHKNARTTPFGRAVMVRRVLEEGWTVAAVASAFEVSTRTVRKWLARFGSEGAAGLQNRSSAPHLVANKLAAPWLDHDRPAAPRVPDDRRGDRRAASPARSTVAGHLRRLRPRPAGRARAERAGAALQPRTRRRARPPRYQEARPLPAHRPPHHRRSARPERAAPAGSSSTSRSTTPPARLRRGPAGREAPVGHRLPGPGAALVQSAAASGSSA